MNNREKAKSTSTFDFTTLYTTTPQNLLITVLSEVINFAFKSKTRSPIGFSKTSVYWTSNVCGRRYFTKQTLIDAVSFLITKCYFIIGNLVFKQETGIPKGIDTAHYWANLFIFF